VTRWPPPTIPAVPGPCFSRGRNPGAVFSQDALIAAHSSLLAPVLETMLQYEYGWGNDAESWQNVFEESLVRAATIWTEYEEPEAADAARREASMGFVHVPVLLDCLWRDWRGPAHVPRFIECCLRECAGVGSHQYSVHFCRRHDVGLAQTEPRDQP